MNRLVVACAIAPEDPLPGVRAAAFFDRELKDAAVLRPPASGKDTLRSILRDPASVQPGDGEWVTGSDVLVVPVMSPSLVPAVRKALAGGIPVVAVASPAVKNVLNGAGIILEAPADPTRLLETLERLRLDRTERETVARRGIERSQLLEREEATDRVEIRRAWRPQERRPRRKRGLGIGIITYNRLETLQGCVRSVEACTHDFYLAIADDGSDDGSAAWARECGIPVVTGRNRGIAWNKNRALAYLLEETECDPILLLEDDCWPTVAGWEEAWFEAARRWGHVNYAVDTGVKRSRAGCGTPMDPYWTDYLSGLCTVTTREALEMVGYLDARFKNYGYEHIEWTWRFRRAGLFGDRFEETGARGWRDASPCLNCGVEMMDAGSYRDETAVLQNEQLLMALRRAPVYRPATRGDDAAASLRHELGRARWAVAPSEGEPALVSVICPTRKPELARRMARTLGNGPYELIWVWNGEGEVTLPEAGCVPAKTVQYREEPFNYSEAINRGAMAARGSVLLIINDDVELTCVGLMERLLELYAERPDLGPCYGDLGGAWEVVPAPEAPGWEGCCWAISHNAFEQMGGLEETLRDYGGDEFVTQVRRRRLGFQGARLRGWTYRHQTHATYADSATHRSNVRQMVTALGWTGTVPADPTPEATFKIYGIVEAGETVAPPREPAEPSNEARHKPLIAPLQTGDCERRWEGRVAKKPWEYRITAVVPHLETPVPLRACVELLRLQTERPYILVIDTGSSPGVLQELETLRADDLEVHYIAGHGYPHPSEAVGVAQDLGFALCRTEHLFCTHADCFLRRRDYLEWLLVRCDAEMPVIGYQMSPRDWITEQWQGMVSHTATMLHMPTMQRLGVTWSFERAHNQFGIERSQHCWPDTETCMNLVLRAAGVKPMLIGDEQNFRRHVDENVDHVRNFPGSLLYTPSYHETAKDWMRDALHQAWERIAAWRDSAACPGPSG